MASMMFADALATLCGWTSAIFVSFHRDITPDLDNTQPIQMVDIMSADAQTRPVVWASAAVMLMIVKDVLFLSVFIFELENTLPTRMVNSMSADALAIQVDWTSVAVMLTIVKAALFFSIITHEMENTWSTQMVDIMSADDC